MNHPSARTVFTLLCFAVSWLGTASVLLVALWPALPRTQLQGVALVAFGPPLYVLAERLFAWLLSTQHGHAISRSRLSLRRILVALPVALLSVALGQWLSWLATR